MNRGNQPLTLAWAHEEVMDVKPAIVAALAELTSAGADGTYSEAEMQRVTTKLRKALTESEQATIAVGVATLDDRKAERVRRGGVIPAAILSEEARYMELAEGVGLDVPNAAHRNRRYLHVLPTPVVSDTGPEAA